MPDSQHIDEALLGRLRDIVGDDGVISLPEELMTFESDGYSINKHVPHAVVLPRSTEEVQAIMREAHPLGIPVVPRGAGTGLSGGAVPVQGGLIISVNRMKEIIEVDYINRVAVVQPGVVNMRLSQKTMAEGWYFAPDPSSQSACTIGGNVAENSGGPHCLKYGSTTHHILGVELVLPDGSVVTLGGKTDADGIGYDLRGVVIASEGMTGVVTKIWARITHMPESVQTFLVVFDTMEDTIQAVTEVITAGIIPAALEVIDNWVIQAIIQAFEYAIPGDAGAILILELDGIAAGMETQADMIEDIFRKNNAREVRLAKDDAERNQIWMIRKRSIGALGRLSPNYYTQDAVVPRTTLPYVLKRIYEIGEKHDLKIGNVFHAGDGNLHPVVSYDERVEGMTARVMAACDDIMATALEVGGALTGEHGIGYEKRNYMLKTFTEDDLDVMKRLRRVFDPEELCNPDKVFPSGAGCGEVGVRHRQIVL